MKSCELYGCSLKRASSPNLSTSGITRSALCALLRDMVAIDIGSSAPYVARALQSYMQEAPSLRAGIVPKPNTLLVVLKAWPNSRLLRPQGISDACEA